ncbi:MAG TPA: hypothetical protein VHD76_14570 [Bryobacteraceae bacterium]|nr:hypothetical protein [Bryobacteraceae bacterium]
MSQHRKPHTRRTHFASAVPQGGPEELFRSQREALRGVRLVVYDSVADYIRRAGEEAAAQVEAGVEMT